ncbi:TerB family tellurite resistance protein [Elusimicrobiota bacterium]
MFDVLKKMFGEEQVKKDIIENDISLAAAVILLEVAYSDKDFTEDERDFIVNTLKNDFGLSDVETQQIIELGTHILEEDTNKWRYINIINEHFSNEKKRTLIEKVWELIYADEILDKYEDILIHRLSNVLHIPHHQLIDIKLKVKNSKGT